jgi:hypothetical protein
MNNIPNSQLIENDIPSRRDPWKKILPFAHTFNGYKHWGSFEKCRQVARHGVDLHKADQDSKQSLTDLRTCLFFEARRWNHFEKTPSKKSMDYIHALVEAIRILVRAKELP